MGIRTNDSQGAALQHAEGRLSRLLERQQTLLDATDRFEQILDSTGDPRLSLIIRSYYAVGLTDEMIAEDTGLTSRYINRLRNRFIRSLS